jgi:hypothetical protein
LFYVFGDEGKQKKHLFEVLFYWLLKSN